MDKPSKPNKNAKVARRPRAMISWHDVPEGLLRDFVVACEAVGVSVVFGRTINGTALSICLLDGAGKPKDYINQVDDIIPVLEGLLWAVDADVPASLAMDDASF